MSGTPMMLVTPALVGDQVYEVIEHAIFTGALPGGSRLRVRDLAAMVGTSVQPVRDAIRRLEEAGLAERSPHKGAVVRDFSVAELLQIYSVRTLLETEGARLGAGRVSAADIQVMRGALDDMRAAVAEGRVSDALDADEELLRTLYRAGENAVLVNLIETLWKQCRPYKVIGATAAMENSDSTLWAPQPHILEAAESRDVARAVEVTEQSLLSARRRLEGRLASEPATRPTPPDNF